MMMEGLAGGIDESAGDVIKSATDMTDDLNSVFNDLSADLTASVPNHIDVGGIDGVSDPDSVRGGFILQLNISNFNNYSSEDITDLTNEIMATAGAFVQRKGAVFA